MVKCQVEGLSPDAVVGSGKRTRRLEVDLERLTDLKSNTPVIEIAEYTACSCLPRFRVRGRIKSREGLLFPISYGFFSLGVEVLGNMLYGGAKRKQWN